MAGLGRKTLTWVLFLLASMNTWAQPVERPESAEAGARQKKGNGPADVRFAQRRDVIATRVSDETGGNEIYVGLAGDSGLLAARYAGVSYFARKKNGVWSTWQQVLEDEEDCATPEVAEEDMKKEAFDGESIGYKGEIAFIAVGFLYTDRFEAAVGGTHNDVVATVAVAMAQLQDAMANTNIPTQYTVTTVERTSYDEGEAGSVKVALDKFAASAANRRSQTNSDLFHLLIHGDQFGTVGVAKLYTGYSRSAYGVTRNLAYGNAYTFVHEISHNLGAGHSPQNGCGYYSQFRDSCGHFVSGVVRDFMTYNENCLLCDVALMYSTPTLPFSTGGGSSSAPSGIAGQRNNARIVAYTSPRVAAFEDSASALPEPLAVALGEAVLFPLLGEGADSVFADGFEPF
jgi:hypothetical protein